MKGKKKPIVLAAANEAERQRWVEAMSDFREGTCEWTTSSICPTLTLSTVHGHLAARKKKVLEYMNTTEVPFYGKQLLAQSSLAMPQILSACVTD